MNRVSCEREEQTNGAIRSGTINAEITLHAQHCPACSDILLVSEFLRNSNARDDRKRTSLPDPGLIWRKAQRRATEQAFRLASRPIRWMTVLACIAFACSPWLRLLLPLAREVGSSWSKTVDSNLASLSKMWPTTSYEPVILLGASGTMILLALSSWLILREE